MKNNCISLLKSCYLVILRLLPNFRRKAAVVYIMSFSTNDGGLIRCLAKRYEQDFYLFYTKKTKSYAKELARSGVQISPYTLWHLLFRNQISLLKNARVVLVDNYFPELCLLKKDQALIQLWHAIGAIKKFGWETPATHMRPKTDQRRFQQVYDQFTDIVVASESMSTVFQRSYQVSPNVFRYLGVPQADRLLSLASEQFDPEAAQVLYAPTYRETPAQMALVLKQALTVFAKFPKKQFLVKLHPTVTVQSLDLPENVYVTTMPLQQLFPKAELLITDYSACIFEFLLYKKMPQILFFLPDKECYEHQPGIQEDFWATAPGQITRTTEELQKALLTDSYKEYSNQAKQFHELWNNYNDGETVNRVMELVQTRIRRKK